MMILPKEKPVYYNLSSDYVDVSTLIQHCQLEFGSGCAHFRAPEMEGVIFFMEEKLLNGLLQDGENKMVGEKAIHFILETVRKHNCNISIYKINPEKILFWANLPTAESVHKNLNTKFVDLEGLLKKMETEKLTGFIDIHIRENEEGAIIFFQNGKVTGGSYSWAEGDRNNFSKDQQLLMEKVREGGGIFHVNRISLPFGKEENKAKESKHEITPHTIAMLEELLNLFEILANSNKKMRERFDFLIKNKFIEKLESYPFLNPFLGTLEYTDQRLLFKGEAKEEELIQGILVSVKELAEEFGLLPELTPKLIQWAQKHQKDLEEFGIHF